ncbi:putative MFS multidrug resistance transporter [Talaromyces proteolyticus]|uniref:MFS multidrug resistance transporter n=1 Tax=Talaromyces proteolyticus TaxID=1131652 RepID=A0AAD4KVB6_9EURO|nr:putative MFS multidrug resistance transporter [Talaromyces proteolyticus]KAH8701892.1 putative MFS multidrug resistance transporter [Talaromyces proteolyticus]
MDSTVAEKTAVTSELSKQDHDTNTVSPRISQESVQHEISGDEDHSDASTVAEEPANTDIENAQHVIRQVTTDIGPPVPIPRLKRRGLFAQLAVLPEVENPKTYPRRTKWFLTIVVALAAAAAPIGTSIFLPSLHQVTTDLHTTATIANLSIALYLLAMSIFPLWWSSFSEAFGRRSIYIASFALFTLFNVLCAISNNIAMLIVMRLLAGGAAASVQAVGAGSIADLWEVRERGRAMSYFYVGPLCGPLFAPIIGGLLANRWGWRSTMWFSMIFGGVIFVLILFALPETLESRQNILREAEQTTASLDRTTSRVSSTVVRGTAKWLKILKMIFLDPLAIILYLRYFPIALTIYYAAITFGSLYILNISVQQTFEAAPYNFSTLIVGLLYIPNSLGYMITALFGGKWSDTIMHREAVKAGRYDEKGRPIYLPEDRMKENAWLGCLLYPVALIVYGWTAQKGVHWIVPMIANFGFGIGSMLIFAVSTTMLTEFLPKKSSSGVALNNFVRNIFSCVGTIVTSPIIRGIGNGWLFTIIGLVALVSGLAVLSTMKKFGPRWREKPIDH